MEPETDAKVVAEEYPKRPMMFTLIDKKDIPKDGPDVDELVLESISSSDEDEAKQPNPSTASTTVAEPNDSGPQSADPVKTRQDLELNKQSKMILVKVDDDNNDK